jgi:Tfp pilus assembly protein PilP
MKLTTGILAVAMMTGAAWGQNPGATNNARSGARAAQHAGKPAAGAPASSPFHAAAAIPPQRTAPPVPLERRRAIRAAAVMRRHDAFAPKQPVAARTVATTKIAAHETPVEVSKIGTTPQAAPKPEEKKWAMNGKRDPFFSPVVQATSGSGCSSGKKCLEVGQINLRGVVKADSGFIAVVTNSLNKAYFLHENDPVFNGYVLKITGDSVVFQETVQDKLGKPMTQEVVKRITTPAV